MHVPDYLDPDLAEAYRQAAERNVLAALNEKVFFGFFSVCADGQGHGGNTTYPGLDWGQSAEALLWLGRRAEVLASWEYVKQFQREDGRLPFAILPDLAGKTVMLEGKYELRVENRSTTSNATANTRPKFASTDARSVGGGSAPNRRCALGICGVLRLQQWIDLATVGS